MSSSSSEVPATSLLMDVVALSEVAVAVDAILCDLLAAYGGDSHRVGPVDFGRALAGHYAQLCAVLNRDLLTDELVTIAVGVFAARQKTSNRQASRFYTDSIREALYTGLA